MKLNTENGEFEFENWIFTPKYKLKDIKEKLPLEGLELWSSHSQWQSFRLTMVKDYILIIMFKDEIINYITIFPITSQGEDHENNLQGILMSLGGEENYSWGKVEINIDPKAGFESIAIRYT
jgi:hypothetical protein